MAMLTLGSPASADPLITEFMADNKSTLADEDGQFPDWIEIHNPSATPLSLDGWSLTDTATNLTRWKFPAITLHPGEFRIVWASNKNRRAPSAPLHTNFALANAGEYLALVRPDGTMHQDFGPAFPAQGPDESFGLRFVSETLVAAGNAGRYRIAANEADLPQGWQEPSFADSGWAAGASGYGFGMTVPGISVRHVFKNGAMQGLADAVTLASLPDGHPSVLRSVSAVVPVLDFLGDGPEGRFTRSKPPPGGSGDHYVIRATGWIEIPEAGFHTFGTHTDDGGRVLIDGTPLIVDDAFHAPADRFGSRFLSKGLHEFEVIMFEGGGGDCLEFFAAPGQLSAWDASRFRLVSRTADFPQAPRRPERTE
jgi:hypothetical protein